MSRYAYLDKLYVIYVSYDNKYSTCTTQHLIYKGQNFPGIFLPVETFQRRSLPYSFTLGTCSKKSSSSSSIRAVTVHGALACIRTECTRLIHARSTRCTGHIPRRIICSPVDQQKAAPLKGEPTLRAPQSLFSGARCPVVSSSAARSPDRAPSH